MNATWAIVVSLVIGSGDVAVSCLDDAVQAKGARAESSIEVEPLLLTEAAIPQPGDGENPSNKPRTRERSGAGTGEGDPGGLEARMKDALQAYIEGFERGDAESLAALFAADATIEDPVGGGRIVQGERAIAAFYRRAIERVERLELDAPIRGSHGRSAAMAFTIHMKGSGRRIRAIDVMSFDESGKIVEMKAYHGPSDVFFE